ncbi:uncharacterized protein LOC116250018 [Nymphaea colorata]|uniref:Uncharacterized protein n=1 Tax=Nymphaea colorata TaxID=210225 RepID=A0A5K1BR03_9MAGN|nr:uncharacterized protein LOC116250018 [Nymphaea colorata]
MSAVVLRSQDCLADRFGKLSMGCLSRTPKTGRNRPRSGRRKRSPAKSDGKDSLTVKFPAANLVMERVHILKRGEALRYEGSKAEEKRRADGDFLVCSTERIGPEPELVPRKIRLPDIKTGRLSVDSSGPYAGTAFESSPSPSSLPLPAFCRKTKSRSEEMATKDIRRMLQLDF